MRAVRFDTLREAVRVRYKLPEFTTTGSPTLAEVNALINGSLQSFYAMLMEAFGDAYFTASATITTTASVELSSLPTRCEKLMSLHWVRGTNDVVPIKRADRDDMRLAGFEPQSWTQFEPKYQLSGVSAVQWLPTPNTAYTVIADFAQLPADLSANTDTFNAGPGWEEWVVEDVCAKIAVSDGESPGVYANMRQWHEDRIRLQKPRNEATSRQAVDRRGAREKRYVRERLFPWSR